MGWLILAFGVLGQGSFVISGYADYGLLVRPGALPAARLVASYFPADAVTGFACLAFILLLTPTGALPSAHWRPWAALIAATSAGLLLTVALTPAPAVYRHPGSPFDLHGFGGAQLLAYQIALPVVLLALVAGGLSLVVRFHRATGTERLQLRWVSLAAGLVALVLIVFLASLAAGVPSLPDPGLVGTVCLAILTLGISAATLGYRLYDLDRIISRTLAYGLLTVLLGGCYAAVILGLSQLASYSSLTVALATLASRWRSGLPGGGSRTWSTGLSTGAATMPPGPSRPSPPGCGTSPTSTSWPATCWPWSTRPSNQPVQRSGWHLTWAAVGMTAAAATLHGEYKFDLPNGVGFMPELNDPEWGLCAHGPYLPADYRDDEEDYDEEWDEAGELDESDAYGEWDGYDDEAEVEALARLAAKIEPGRATVAQWAQAIRRLGAQRRSRARR